jgi:transposase-like protein
VKSRRRFTKEFKEAAVRRVEEGTPVKQVAVSHKIDPAVVRAWRAEMRDFGPEAFTANGKRAFTKEFKEAAVRRVEEGMPVKQVARACRVDPNMLRRWRGALRDQGANAFRKSEPRTRVVIFKLTEQEFHRLKAIAKTAGARSVSDYARSRLFAD